MESLILMATVMLAAFICFLIVRSKAKDLSCLQILYDQQARKNEMLNEQIVLLTTECAEWKTQTTILRQNQEDAQKQMEERRRQLDNEFRILAGQILEEKTARFTKVNQDALAGILNPLKENIDEFKKKVSDSYDQESKQRFSLEERIKELVQLNTQMSSDARNLARALRSDSKAQGDWGEMILQSVLEKSGLQKNLQYFVQETLCDENGKSIKSEEGKIMRPDVVIAYPDNRKIIVDSKVSLTAYARYTETEDQEEMKSALAEHISSIRKHIKELSDKSYQNYIDTADFVMMFIPNEPAYMVALQENPSLWQEAYDKRVLLISPTNLITALKLVADLWKRENQSRNALEIAERGGRLYDKFALLVSKLNEVGTRLDQTASCYREAMGQLRDGNGNLIGQVEKLRELGVKAKKQISGAGSSL